MKEISLGKGKEASIHNGTIRLTDDRIIVMDGKAVVILTAQDIRALSVLMSENL